MKRQIMLYDHTSYSKKDEICYKCKGVLPSMHTYYKVAYHELVEWPTKPARLRVRGHVGPCHDELIQDIRAEFELLEE